MILAALLLTAGVLADLMPQAPTGVWDFEYTNRTVFDANAMDYVVSVTNAHRVQETQYISFWTPVAAGTQAVIRYRFTFPQPALTIRLRAHTSTWNYWAGVGDASIWASRNGTDWTLVLDNPAPIGRIDSGKHFDDFLPSALTGARELWVEARMLRRGGSYPYGGVQFTRADTSGSSPEAFAVRAQYGSSGVTFPLDAVTAEGTAGYPGLFAAPRARTQTVMTASGFSANTPGNVTALSWRRDRGTQVYTARRVDLAIRLGTPTTNPYGMSSTFAQNHSVPLQEAFRGFVDVPEAQPELTGPAPFIVRVPLSTPWAWSGGDALLEVEVFSNSVSGFGGWEVDMQARQRGAGTVAPLGTGCSSSWGAPLLDAPDPRDLIPGGRIDQRLRAAPPGAIAAAWFGNRTDEWSGVPLPFTFPNSACTIYTNNMVGVLLPVFGDGATALLSVPLPADPIVNGLTVYSQWGVLEPFAYPPITTTRALALTAAAAPSVWFDTIANLDGSATGVRSPEAYAAPVVQLEVR